MPSLWWFWSEVLDFLESADQTVFWSNFTVGSVPVLWMKVFAVESDGVLAVTSAFQRIDSEWQQGGCWCRCVILGSLSRQAVTAPPPLKAMAGMEAAVCGCGGLLCLPAEACAGEAAAAAAEGAHKQSYQLSPRFWLHLLVCVLPLLFQVACVSLVCASGFSAALCRWVIDKG